MSNYQDVLEQAKSLTPEEQLKQIREPKTLVETFHGTSLHSLTEKYWVWILHH